ncbi:MFS transporter [Sphingomonas sp. MMS24-J45]|uniref:MFS transporter n=1 Tax=Sphingomonas sp. MMS24-J45 TaxID=3238806 RepID=UPI00384E61A7
MLAMFGAFATFVPLFALILPQKVAALPDLQGHSGVTGLSWILVAGGAAAGGGNIVAGVISDAWFRRTRNRRRLIAVGVITVAATLAAIAGARAFWEILLSILAFQLALNLMLSPLVALMVDYVPDRQKGRMAGWLGLALPFGSLMVTALTIVARRVPGMDQTGALIMIIGTLLMLVMPLILLWPVPALIPPQSAVDAVIPGERSGKSPVWRRTVLHDFALAWTARLLVQFAAAAIIPYLYFYVADVVRPVGGARAIGAAVGVLAFAFASLSIVGALSIGWLSDRFGRRRLPLATAALLVAISMATLSIAPGWPITVAAYGSFSAGLAGFLAIDSALVAQLVAVNTRRATLLGVMNLTNTLPAILAPAMALVVIGEGRGAVVPLVFVMQVAAAGALVAALCASRIRTLR